MINNYIINIIWKFYRYIQGILFLVKENVKKKNLWLGPNKKSDPYIAL